MVFYKKATALHIICWLIIYSALLLLELKYEVLLLETAIQYLIVYIFYELIMSFIVYWPMYGYIKNNRPDIYKDFFDELPRVNHIKLISYAFHISDKDDQDTSIIKRYTIINFIFSFIMFWITIIIWHVIH